MVTWQCTWNVGNIRIYSIYTQKYCVHRLITYSNRTIWIITILIANVTINIYLVGLFKLFNSSIQLLLNSICKSWLQSGNSVCFERRFETQVSQSNLVQTQHSRRSNLNQQSNVVSHWRHLTTYPSLTTSTNTMTLKSCLHVTFCSSLFNNGWQTHVKQKRTAIE